MTPCMLVRSSSRSRPASTLVSPSRSRSTVLTLRVVNTGSASVGVMRSVRLTAEISSWSSMVTSRLWWMRGLTVMTMPTSR